MTDRRQFDLTAGEPGRTGSGGDPAANGATGDGARPHGTPARDEDGFLERLVVKRAGRVFFVDVDRIDWFEAADYYVRLHTGDDKHLLRITMKELERTLDPGRFIRIHRSHIVRIDVIRELQPYFHGEYVVILEDGTKLPLSRSRRKKLERALGQRL